MLRNEMQFEHMLSTSDATFRNDTRKLCPFKAADRQRASPRPKQAKNFVCHTPSTPDHRPSAANLSKRTEKSTSQKHIKKKLPHDPVPQGLLLGEEGSIERVNEVRVPNKLSRVVCPVCAMDFLSTGVLSSHLGSNHEINTIKDLMIYEQHYLPVYRSVGQKIENSDTEEDENEDEKANDCTS